MSSSSLLRCPELRFPAGRYGAERRSCSTSTTIPATATQEGASAKTDKMATDEDYMAFLDKANQDPNEGVAKGSGNGKVQLKNVDEGVKVPACIQKVLKEDDKFYVSEADEPFVGVALKLAKGKGLPDECTFPLIPQPFPITLFSIARRLVHRDEI